jgi:RNA polymerase-interacting CarD/CdnL/TRCF family regulator
VEEAGQTELTEPGHPVFYPKVGHCIYRGIVEDPSVPGTKLVELEDIEEGGRILVPLDRVPKLGLRPAGTALEVIREELASEFESPMENDEDRQTLLEELISEGSPGGLAKALKILHLIRQNSGLTREEEQTRRKVRSWLAAEVALAKDCTRAEAQALITRVLQETMASHRRKEKEEAKERRRIAKEKEKADSRASQDNSKE